MELTTIPLITKALSLIKLLFNFTLFIFQRNLSQLEDANFNLILNDTYNKILNYFITWKAPVKGLDTKGKDLLFFTIKTNTKKRKKFFLFDQTKLEKFILKELMPTSKLKIDKFIIFSFLYINGNIKRKSLLVYLERLKCFFRIKYTILHYLSISNWRNKSWNELIKEVQSVSKIDPIWKEKYNFKKDNLILEKNRKLSNALSKVIENGKITETTIQNLASSEKIMFIHKYAEGFSELFNEDNSKIAEFQKIISKLEDSNKEKDKEKIRKAEENIKNIKDNRIRTPIAVTLENYGFVKLFHHMDGVYIYPLSLLPSKYHNNHIDFIKEVILQGAENYIKELKKSNPRLSNMDDDLNYLILSHIIQINKLNILSAGRNMSYSSPKFAKLLLAAYITNENSMISNMYINDIIRNVDFMFLINKNNKTDKFITNKIEELKSILWDEYNIDIYKPYYLKNLTKNQVDAISTKLIGKSKKIKKHHLIAFLNKKVKFYKDLEKELNTFK